MLRRISTIAAAAAMLAVSALPASAATLQSHSATHKFSFPGLHGLSAWGTYQRTGSRVKVSVCAKDTLRSITAAGAVTIGSNGSRSQTLGAVAIGYNQTVCRSQTLIDGAHLKIYTFTAKGGSIASKSKTKTVY
jgi:hypothetical protein